MKKIIAVFTALATCALGFGVPSFAGEKLDRVNAQVDKQSFDIDQKYGVLPDYQEREDMRLDLISKQALQDNKDSGKPIRQIAEETFIIYEITDQTEQRKLLIKMETQTSVNRSTGSTGNEPDYP